MVETIRAGVLVGRLGAGQRMVNQVWHESADIIEWLGDHTSSSSDNDIRNSGGGGVGRGDVDQTGQTSANVLRLSNDDRINNNNGATESTNNHHHQEEDDDNEDEEEVQILTESLRELGFDEGEIHHKKELYRRASKNSGVVD